jgi:chromosome partitioning protein
MGVFDTVDWAWLDALFGRHGNIIIAAVALSVVVIGFLAVILRYLHGRVLQNEREACFARLEKERAVSQQHQRAVATKDALLERKDEALRQAAAMLKGQQATLNAQREEIQTREQCHDNLRLAFVGKDHDLWCLHPARKPDDYDSRISHHRREKPIILVANPRAGVGKTTLTANLAARFAEAGKRVLLVDADHQGALSHMVLSADGVPEFTSQISRLLAPGSDLDTYESAVVPFTQRLKRSGIIAAKSPLAAIESRLMIEYLLQEDNEWDDGRYRLASLLLHDDVAETYDIALIDAPPRLGAATVNGFCAATHLLVPTVYDTLSVEAVGSFLDGAQVMKAWLNPGIDLLGVVGMLTTQHDQLNAREQQAEKLVRTEISRAWGGSPHVFDRHIPRKETIATAVGDNIAFYADREVRRWFYALGDAVLQRLTDQAKTSRQPRGADEWSEWVRTAMATAAE